MSGKVLAELGQGMEVRLVSIADLREQELNARVMQPAQFERLSENIRTRGALESLPYCWQPPDGGHEEIVSGHHRVRAARAAGLQEIPVLVDTLAMSRSQITAKQIAHNQLAGYDDQALLKELTKQIQTVDDWLETGLPEEFLPAVGNDDTLLLTPHAEFDWRTVTLTFLPHQLESFKELISEMVGQQDLVAVSPVEQFEPFCKALAEYSRIKSVKSAGTAVALLTEVAQQEIAAHTAPNLEGDDETWVPVSAVLGTTKIPAPVARVLRQALDQYFAEGEVTEKNYFQALEFLAAEKLAA